MAKKQPQHITNLIRKRSKLYKKFSRYEKERTFLLKALQELSPPTVKEYEDLQAFDLEISRYTMSLHLRDK